MRFYIVPLVAILVLCVPCNRAEDSAGPEQTDNVVQENSPEQTDNVVQENGPENSNHAAEGVEDPEKKDKTSDIEEEKDVMVLHIKNFHRALSENKFLLVEFYAPWCGHCQQLEPVYAEAAGLLKTERTVGEGGSVGVSLAKVDATEEKELAEEFDVGSFPTIKLFMNGDRKNPIDFTGKRTVKGIVQWLERRSGPSAVVLDSPAAAAEHIRLHNITVVGFFTSLESEAVKVFHNVAMEMVDTVFGVTTSPEVFQKYEVKNNRVVLFKKFDEGRADLPVSEEGKLDQDDLTVFIKNNSLELLIEFNEEVHTLIWFMNPSGNSRLFDHVLKYFGLSVSDVPAVRIINTDTVKKFNLIGQITAATLQTFCQGVLDGTVKPHLLSEDVPEDWDKGVVKVLVGKNFEAVVRDKNKNVFVEFYAPWCGHCKELAPVWEKLGEKYADHNDIIIAKMDATANEVEGVSVSGFPTLMYYPAGDDKEVEYGGTRDLETFIKFLDNGGQLPQEEVEQEEDIEEVTFNLSDQSHC
uniref:protein disulfide-isomerase n=1 Tax=Esox lucius TaxID=8010 RepID=A0A6Q2XZ44_ESOLU